MALGQCLESVAIPILDKVRKQLAVVHFLS
jgi:hypothetical protein